MEGKRKVEEYYSARKRSNALLMEEEESSKTTITRLSKLEEVREQVFHDPFVYLPYEGDLDYFRAVEYMVRYYELWYKDGDREAGKPAKL